MDKRFRTTVLIMGVLLVAGGVWFLLSFSVSTPSESPFTSSFSYNVILISIDTLRADHLGMYGYSRDTSPNLDRFAEESILFEQAITQAGATLPSHASLFTSQYPDVHRTSTESLDTLSPLRFTLAEVLKQYGFKTAGFIAGTQLSDRSGVNRGFDTYINGGSLADNFPLAVKWLKQNKKEDKFFLFVHGYDVRDLRFQYLKYPPKHVFDPDYKGIFSDHKSTNFKLRFIEKIKGKPFLVLGNETIPLEQRDLDHVIAHYDDGILYTDPLIQQFLNTLKELDLYDTSIIVIFSDHGESLGESLDRQYLEGGRLIGHGELYDEVIRIPLIIRHPDFEGQRISTQVQLIDIFPTILDFLDLSIFQEAKQQIQGRSLVSLIEGRTDKQFEYTYGGGEQLNYNYIFVRTNQWKLISSREEFELYNLKDDPKETHNVISQYSDTAERLKQKLEEWKLINLTKRAELE